MANISARWHGDKYQSRRFWIQAALLLDKHRPDVVEVTFEADGPKAFDDVVVRYQPGRRNLTGPERISADYFQIKWHTDDSGHFGYEDLTIPEFVHGTAFSLLQRLRDAKAKAEPNSAFHFVTTYNLRESDPLTELVSGVDGSLRLDRLFDGTKTGKSRMGTVRKLWKEHLQLESDEDLKSVLAGFYIEKGAKSLNALGDEVVLCFRIVNLKGRDAETTFIYDQAAQDLVTKGLNRLDRETFRKYCESEGWFIPASVRERRGIAIQTYEPRAFPADIALASTECTLVLRDYFDGRHIRASVGWDVVKGEVRTFLKTMLDLGPEIRLFLEAPASLAFLAGKCLGFKSGASVEVVQSGSGNSKLVWDTDDGKNGPMPRISEKPSGDGSEIAIAVSVTRDALPKVEQYVSRNLPEVGVILQIVPEAGAGQKAIAGGEHALKFAEFVANVVSNRVVPGAKVHIFLAAPNALSFYLGQQADSMGKCVLYEFDHLKERDGSYEQSFEV